MVKCRILLGILCFLKRVLREGLFFVLLNQSSINLSHNSNASPIDNYNQTHSRQLIKWQNTQLTFAPNLSCLTDWLLMKESPKPQLKFFYYKEASTFSWKKREENGSLKLFPNLYKKEGKKIKNERKCSSKYLHS